VEVGIIEESMPKNRILFILAGVVVVGFFILLAVALRQSPQVPPPTPSAPPGTPVPIAKHPAVTQDLGESGFLLGGTIVRIEGKTIFVTAKDAEPLAVIVDEHTELSAIDRKNPESDGIKIAFEDLKVGDPVSLQAVPEGSSLRAIGIFRKR
jgi:hypothetical protein